MMLKKLLSVIILLCFTLSTSVEARKHVRRSSIASHMVKKAKVKKTETQERVEQEELLDLYMTALGMTTLSSKAA